MKLIVLMTVVMVGQALSPSSHLAPADLARLKAVFVQSCTPETDISNLFYSVLGMKLLGETAPNKDKLCAAAAKLSDDSSVENLYAASGTAAALGCPLKFGAKATEALKTSVGDGSSTASIFFATKALVSGGGKVDKAVAKALTSALKKDDSLLSLGLSFHVASLLDGDVSSVFDRIEDALVQADEVDGKLLQFEGGLSVTSVLLTGAASLAIKAKKPLPVTGEQAVKFANYLLSRKSVQQPKGALHLLEGVESMTGKNAQFTPLAISLASPLAVSAANPNVDISVSDLKGASAGDMKVTVASITRLSDDQAIATNVDLKKAGSSYSLDLMALKPTAGFYELVVSATNPGKTNAAIVGNTNVKLTVKVLTTISINNAELQVLESDSFSGGRSVKLAHPKKEGSVVPVQQKEKIHLSFNLQDTVANTKTLVHQAFVKIARVDTGAEILYVAEADKNKDYQFELDLGSENVDVQESGKYTLTLILGDAVMSNPVSWAVADLDIQLAEDAEANLGPYAPKPEIKHMFREPEKRPPAMVSTVFTLLCLSPILLLLVLWIKLGVNISNFNLSPTTIGFHLGLGSIFVLYTYFWLELNMFETVRYLVVLGIVTFLCGNSLLASIAKKNK